MTVQMWCSQFLTNNNKYRKKPSITVTGVIVVCHLHLWLALTKGVHRRGCFYLSLPRVLSHARWSIVTPMGAKGEAEKQAWSHLPSGLGRAPPTSTLSCHIHPHAEAARHLQLMHRSTVKSRRKLEPRHVNKEKQRPDRLEEWRDGNKLANNQPRTSLQE